eukprot:CAMPEP_0173400682 /NCGR_PEP_ID=MMETSP1356-20130122/48659_1 /TAXON_ID=77927 ORGANISM="Hemiselmis virescens, Strain PCC157" /NCGR_SAMPLE_ID=MMETSP1356 /ASSEMBLY_ACC=CAM_ASM_000847 /LENGTH=41 /DNA_ID= /DNA_START= /DNA_END= /DNA_ORIENTATION=
MPLGHQCPHLGAQVPWESFGLILSQDLSACECDRVADLCAP